MIILFYASKSRAKENKFKGGLQPLADMGIFLCKLFEGGNKKKLILAQALKNCPFWEIIKPFYVNKKVK